MILRQRFLNSAFFNITNFLLKKVAVICLIAWLFYIVYNDIIVSKLFTTDTLNYCEDYSVWILFSLLFNSLAGFFNPSRFNEIGWIMIIVSGVLTFSWWKWVI